MPTKERLSAYLLPETKEALQSAAAELGRSAGTVIDDLVAMHLASDLRTRISK